MAGRPLIVMLVFGSLLIGPAHVLAAPGDVVNGETIYNKRCSQCHGEGGDAKGPGADYMLPRPRVFAENTDYKFTSVPNGELPTDDDLYRVISLGIPGSSMPDFDILDEQERWDLVAYIKSLSEDFQDPEATATSVIHEDLVELVPTVSSPEAIERGRAVYEKNKCAQCHGEMGRGNGKGWEDLKDNWGNPIMPRNLTNREYYRNGSTVEDIFRTVTTGLAGSPMAAYDKAATVEERWDLVHYVRSLGPADKEVRDEVIAAGRVETVPEDAKDAAWDEAPSARFETLPNIIEPPRLFWSAIEFVTVQALYSDTDIGLRIQWDDRSASTGTNLENPYVDPSADGFATSDKQGTSIYNRTEHPDQFMVQFPSRIKDEGVRPYFLMGDSKRSVNLWWWRSDTQTILERNAKGARNVSVQAEQSQNLKGSVTYEDGRYTMVVRRSLHTANKKDDIQFAAGRFLPIAFNAWDGSRAEVGTRRSVTAWYWLYLRPDMPDTVHTYPPFAFFISLGLLLILIRLVRRRVGPVKQEEGNA